VMEYLDGSALGRVIAQRGRLPAGSLCRLLEEVLSALGAAHDKGVIHRDIKPDNIFVSLQGRAKILDFGIAKLAAEDRQGLDPTRAGSLLGTPHYMSPEQAQSRPADARTDLYAIGVILYEATTGRKPFTGTSVYEILRGHIELPPVRPLQLVPEMAPALEHVILRALAKDPAQRWQTARELGAALSSACQYLAPSEWDPLTSRPRNESVGPPTPSSTPIGPPMSGRRRTIGVVVAAILLSGAVTAGITLAVTSSPDSTAKPDDRENRVAAETPPAEPANGVTAPPSASADPAPLPPSEAGKVPARDATTGYPASPAADGDVKKAAAPPPVARSGGARSLAPPAAAPTASPAGAPTPPVDSKPKGRRALDERINEKNPAPGAWDVSGYLPKAFATAKTYFPDAVLVRIDADGVYPSGKANLQLDSNFDVLYRFMSPSAAVRPKDLPLGVEHKPTCMLYVVVNSSELTVYTLQGWSCEDQVKIRLPLCSAKEVWARAAAQGAPTDNAVAELSYRIFRGRPMWLLQIGKDHDLEIPDDC